MKALVACEESQAVTIELRKLGVEAYSCDIQECSGGHPEWHIQGDVLEILEPEAHYMPISEDAEEDLCIVFHTMDGHMHFVDWWDLIIAHPPCTYLTLAGNKWFKPEFETRFPGRKGQRQEAIEFFMHFVNALCEHVAIENPVGVMSSQYRKPDQYIEPYYFGDAEKKKTGLWLKGLPKLEPTNMVEPVIIHCASGANEPRWHMETMKLPKEERSRMRSKTFPGIAHAMATQWVSYIRETEGLQ